MNEAASCETALEIGTSDYLIAGAIILGILLVFDLFLPWARKGDQTTGGLLQGVDGRTSTSKATAVAWTLALAFAFLLVGLAGEVECVTQNLQEEYLLLLGGPFAAAIGAKLITAQKVRSGSVEKPEATDDEKKAPARISQLVTDDEGKVDAVGDFQYFVFNLVTLVIFFVAFLDEPEEGLPELPGTLIGLTSASALAYMTKKGVYSEAPTLTGVSPRSAGPGERVRIWGHNLLSRQEAAALTVSEASPPAFAGSVRFGSVEAETVKVIGKDPLQLEAEVPTSKAPGPAPVTVVTPAGSASDELEFEVTASAEIFSVTPTRIMLGQTESLTITGRGFAAPGAGPSDPRPKVMVDGNELALQGTASESSLTAILPTETAALAGFRENQQADAVVVNHLGLSSAPYKVWIEKP